MRTIILKITIRGAFLRILHQIDTLNRDDGGPSRSVQGLCRAQVALGHQVKLICKESDLAQNDWPFEVIQYHDVSKLKELLHHVLNQFDVVHSHAIWLRSNHITACVANMMSKPMFIHPRGLLQQWALNTKKWKKRIAWWVYQRRDLHRAYAIVATAEIEKTDVLRALPKANVELLPNGIEFLGCPKVWIPVQSGRKRALFLSRIHEKKGIVDLVKAWVNIQPLNWELIVAGPDTDGLWKDLSESYSMIENNIEYVAAVDGVEKSDLYRSADLVILPTYSENFGLVIPEALSVGTPVLTTTGTPWSNLPELDCGWCIEPGQKSLEHYLPSVLSLDKETYFQMGQRGSKYVLNTFSWEQIALHSIEIYEKSLCSQR